MRLAPRSIIQKIKKKISRQKHKREAPLVKKEQIVNDLKKILNPGDHLILHSSLKSIGYVDGGAKTVIEAISDAITPTGTLAVPTYSMKGTMYQTCQDKDYIFDPRSSDTRLGLIPAAFLTLPGIYRSIHPTHSVSAIGKEAKFITEAHHLAESTFGNDSPWARLMKLDGKVLCIGMKMGRNTFSHVLEDRMLDDFPLPVRMKKTYFLKCKDWEGRLIEVPVNPLDPKYAKVRIDQQDRKDLRDYFWKEFIISNVINVGRVGQAIAWASNLNRYYDHLVKLMQEGITIYSSPKEIEKRPVES